MVVMGVGVLLPWNAVITAVDYYSATYSFVADDIETYVVFVYLFILFTRIRAHDY